MTDRTDYFARLRTRVDLRALGDAWVVVVGVGSVGSAIAFELARCGVGHLGLVDGDRLEAHNVARHALPLAYVGANKAEAMAAHLEHNVPGVDVGAVPHDVDEAFTETDIDRLLASADVVVAATDDRMTQRRIARRALALDAPAIIPGLYPDRGGEIFVQLGPGHACFLCWDGFREPDAEVRAASSVNADAFTVVQQAVYLSLAVLDAAPPHARDLAPTRGDPRPRQLFVVRPAAALLRAPVTRRPGCPSCAVGPSPLGDRARQSRPPMERWPG
ncbi:MAG: ThiF family adenylyltransferase, partial [Actinomycetota bacterium]|nr:ThiF family adenylyltransferase [Actinomycetota bacterium]